MMGAQNAEGPPEWAALLGEDRASSPSVLVMLMEQPVEQVLQDVAGVSLRLAVLILERRVVAAVQRVQVEPEVRVPHTPERAHGAERADAQDDRKTHPAPTAGPSATDPPADGTLDVPAQAWPFGAQGRLDRAELVVVQEFHSALPPPPRVVPYGDEYGRRGAKPYTPSAAVGIGGRWPARRSGSAPGSSSARRRRSARWSATSTAFGLRASSSPICAAVRSAP